MRKVLFTVALLLTACFVSAQVSVVKEAKSLKSKPEEAAKAIEPALTILKLLMIRNMEISRRFSESNL